MIDIYKHDDVISCISRCPGTFDAPRHGTGCKPDERCRLMVVADEPERLDSGRYLHGIGCLFYKDQELTFTGKAIKLACTVPDKASYSDVYLTNVAKCASNGMLAEVKTARFCATKHLLREIGLYKPEQILAVGSMASLILLENNNTLALKNEILLPVKHYPLQNRVASYGRLVISPKPTELDHWVTAVKAMV
jgi:uracil-DNA glycosylase